MTFNANSWPIRLSPSGPFIRDAVSGAPLPLGPGSIGIVLRAQGTSGSGEAISSTAPTPIIGLDNIPCNLPGGYHYDVKAIIVLDLPAVPGASEPLVVDIEYSDDNGGTWQTFPGARCNALTVAPQAGPAVVEEIDVDRTASPNNTTITNLRVVPSNPGGTGILRTQAGLCTLRVEQYVAAT